jgi:hypothetical protein
MTHNFKEGNAICYLMKLSLAKIVVLLTDERISNEHWWIDTKTQKNLSQYQFAHQQSQVS